MLYFIGLGLEQSPSIKSLKLLKGCDRIYYERYTSPALDEKVLSDLAESLAPSKIEMVKREFVEDGREILAAARDSQVALISSGDPLIATTHQELRTRASRSGIPARVIHGSSVISAAGGELGLHSYNFGRMVTITREPMQYTAYNTLFRNLLLGLHTTVLLEWDESKNFFLKPSQAISSLFDAERDLRSGIIKDCSLGLIVSRLGSDEPSAKALSFKEILDSDLGEPPHVIVVPGRFHFTEREAMAGIFGRDPNSFHNNSDNISKISTIMVSKYSAKTMKALERAKSAASESGSTTKYADVFENVECYTDDANRFLNEGKEELAVLSIGYAEGLLDSLRFSNQLEFDW